MKRTLSVVLAAYSVLMNGLGAAPFRDGDTVVFYGDSITHGGYYHAYVWEYYLTRYPASKITFRNAGIAGDNALDAQSRFQRDVAAHKPDAVSVMFGMNDVGLNLYGAAQTDRVKESRREAVDNYRENLAAIDGLVEKAGIKSVYRLTPTPYEDTAVLETRATRRSGRNAALGKMAQIVRARAAEKGGTLVDLYTTLNSYNREKQAEDPSFTIVGGDRVHPAEPGHLLMAYTFLKTQGVDALVSDVGLDYGRKEIEKSLKATVSDVKWDRESVEFTVLEESLPMPIDGKARAVLDDFPIVRDLNQQILQMRSLPRGRWALEIDGVRVGAWFSPEWERGINLAMNENTPQYKQARKVHDEVMKRRGIENRLVGWKACKWWLDRKKVDSDDWAAVDRFWNSKPNRDGYFERLYPDFRANWDKREEKERKIAAATEACRQAARPVAHRYRIFRVPAYAYRGFMLDEARHFFGKEKVKDLLDVMAAHKMNYFHWHLTDDQGWRIDLPGLPELVKAGARRDASPKRGQDVEPDGVAYGPFFYTPGDIREIVAYAKERGIEVIPEIDLPGHTRTILAAHPEFCCKPREELRKSHNTWGISKDVLCLGNPDVVAYVEKILDAVCKLFPCRYVHIGGDECPGDNWWGCSKCRAKIDREGLVDCPRLQASFMSHLAGYLAKKGRRAIGWDDVLSGGKVPSGMTVQVWHSDKVRAAAAAGADVIVSTLEEAYLSIPTGEEGDKNWPYRQWVLDAGMTLPVSRIGKFDLEKNLPDKLKGRILGGECCAWTEEIASDAELDFKVKKRLAAFGDMLYYGPVVPCSETEKKKPERVAYPFESTVVVQGTQITSAFAVKEFNAIVKKATGRTFEVRKSGGLSGCENKKKIYIGRGPELDERVVGWWIDKTYGEEESVVMQKDGDLFLFGKDELGSLWSVYDFCEDSLGYRWYLDVLEDAGGEKVDTCATVSWNGVPSRRQPKFRGRRMRWGGVRKGITTSLFRVRNRDNHSVHDVCPQYRHKFQIWTRGHGFHMFLPAGEITYPIRWAIPEGADIKPDNFRNHPEWFSMMADGTRNPDHQLCLSHPGCRKALIEAVSEYVRVCGKGVYMVGVNDCRFGRFCYCKGCLELEKKYNTTGGPMWDFIVEACAEVKKRFGEGVYLQSLAYDGINQTEKAPDNLVFPDNFIVDIAYIHCPDRSIKQLPDVKAPEGEMVNYWQNTLKWTGITEHSSYWFYGTMSPCLVYRRMADEIRELYEAGVTSPGSCGTGGGYEFYDFTGYLYYKLLQDPYCDIRSHLEEVLRFKYGKAAPCILEYIDELELAFIEFRKGCKGRVFETGMPYRNLGFITGRQIAEWRDLFDKAERLVKDSPFHADNLREAKIGLNVLTVLYEKRIRKDAPGCKFDRRKVLAEGRLAAERYGRRNLSKNQRNYAISILDAAENEMAYYGNLKDEKLPARFDGYQPEFITRILPYKSVSMNANNPEIMTSVPDAQSVCGYAVKETFRAERKIDKGLSCYLWDWSAAKRHPLKTIPLSAFKKGEYTLVKLGVAELSQECSLIIAEGWGTPMAQRFLKRAYDPAYPKKKFEIWASLKAEGPRFFPGDTCPDSLYMEQLFAVEIVGSGF